MVKTKLLMTLSAVSLAFVGLACSFAPQEILTYFGVIKSDVIPLIIQVLGALYLGFAVLNWTAKANLIGGIYSRPVAIGNFMHYLVTSLALVKYFMGHMDHKMILIPLIIYSIFAILFGKVLFGSAI